MKSILGSRLAKIFPNCKQWHAAHVFLLAFFVVSFIDAICLFGYAADASPTTAHIEDVPTDVAHPEPLPAVVIKKQGGKLSLQGVVQKNQQLEALNSRLGMSAKSQGKDLFPSVVKSVTAGSAMAKRGIVPGDVLVSEATDTNGGVTLTMEHAGQGIRFNIKANELKVALTDGQALTGGAPNKEMLTAGVQDVKKKQYTSLVDVLENHDLGLIIDASASMSTPDCPGGLSRWDWCCQQSQALAEAAAQASSTIDASVFNQDYQTYRHISPLQIPQIFQVNKPGGDTEPAYALKEQLENFFNSRRVKPLTIVIVTDGLPNNPTNVAQVLKEESKKIRYQGEVTITVLIIGEPIDEEQMRSVLGLTPGSSVRNGGFVDIIPFRTTAYYGIKKTLYADLKDVRLSTNPHHPSWASNTATGRGVDLIDSSNYQKFNTRR